MAYYPGSFNYSSPTSSFNFNPALPDWVANPQALLEGLINARTKGQIAVQAPALAQRGHEFNVTSDQAQQQFNAQNQLARRGATLQEQEAQRQWQQQQYLNAQAEQERMIEQGRAVAARRLAEQSLAPQWRLNRTPFQSDTWELVGNTMRMPYGGTAAQSSPRAKRQYVSPYANYF